MRILGASPYGCIMMPLNPRKSGDFLREAPFGLTLRSGISFGLPLPSGAHWRSATPFGNILFPTGFAAPLAN